MWHFLIYVSKKALELFFCIHFAFFIFIFHSCEFYKMVRISVEYKIETFYVHL